MLITYIEGEIELNLIDMHNHTIWSDGEDIVEEIVINAIDKNVTVIGISDHFNTSKCKSVSIKDLNKYLKEITNVKEKYKDKIKVLAGIEICLLPYPNSLENIPMDIINKLDYVLIEYLDLLSPKADITAIESFLSKIKCKKGLAHTNLIKLSNKFCDLDAMAKFIKDNDLYWELNSSSSCDALYYILYKDKEILDIINILKKHNIEIIPGSDTHCLIDYEYGRLVKANEFVSQVITNI